MSQTSLVHVHSLTSPLGHNHKASAKLHKVYPEVTLQLQLLAQGLDDKTERETACDRKLFYLMQNWEILITVRQKHTG